MDEVEERLRAIREETKGMKVTVEDMSFVFESEDSGVIGKLGGWNEGGLVKVVDAYEFHYMFGLDRNPQSGGLIPKHILVVVPILGSGSRPSVRVRPLRILNVKDLDPADREDVKRHLQSGENLRRVSAEAGKMVKEAHAGELPIEPEERH